MQRTKKQKIISAFTLLLLVGGMFSANSRPAKAAHIIDGEWITDNTNSTIKFKNTAELTANDTIVLTFPSESVVDSAGSNVVISGSVSATRTNSASDNDSTNNNDNSITIKLGGTIHAGTNIIITMTDALSSYTPSTFAQQSLAINTIDSTNNGDISNPLDYGIAMVTNDNITKVTASVPLFVTMAVDDDEMDLGTLSVASVKKVNQTYTVNSNDTNGVQVQIEADDKLNNAQDDIDDVTILDGEVSIGEEEYGIKVDSQTFTADGTFGSKDTAVPTTATNLVSNDDMVSSGTFNINYKAAISGTTPAGEYDQLVTVTIATNA